MTYFKNLIATVFLTFFVSYGFCQINVTAGGSSGNTVTGSEASSLGSCNTSSGSRAFSSGFNNTASGYYSTAMGYANSASQSYSVALGYHNFATGSSSMSFGYYSQASNSYSYALGHYAYASSLGSVAIGNWVEAKTGNYAMAIGQGYGSSYKLTNTIANSLAIGFNSDIPTLFISGGSGSGTLGKVGIGTTSPNALLDVRGSAIFNENGGDNDFRIEGDNDANLFFLDASTDKIGIGTGTPSCKLEVNGNIAIGNFLSGDGDNEGIRITSNGSVVINSTYSPTSQMFCQYGGNAYFNNRVDIHDIGCGTSYFLYVAGPAKVSSDFYCLALHETSDKKFKKNINNIIGATDILKSINGVTFEFQTDKYKYMDFPKGKNYGFIAQDIQKILPELISVATTLKGGEKEDYLTIRYTGLIPILVEGFKEQQAIIDNQNNKIEDIEKELAELKQTIALLNDQKQTNNDKAELTIK